MFCLDSGKDRIMAKVFYLLSLYGGEVTNKIMRSYRLETTLTAPLMPGTRTYIQSDEDGYEIGLEVSRHFHFTSYVPDYPGNFDPPTEVKGALKKPDEIYMTLQPESADRFVEDDDQYKPEDLQDFETICKSLEAAGWELVNW